MVVRYRGKLWFARRFRCWKPAALDPNGQPVYTACDARRC
jgi:hypothetical protein